MLEVEIVGWDKTLLGEVIHLDFQEQIGVFLLKDEQQVVFVVAELEPAKPNDSVVMGRYSHVNPLT